MQDIVVIESLRRKGIAFNTENTLMYEAVEHKPRVLDKMPSRLTMTKADDIMPYGCCNEFVIDYQQRKESCSLETAFLETPTAKRVCDVSVYLVLQTLINQGVCYNEDKANACFDLFRLIFMSPGDSVTVGSLYEIIKSYQPCNYFAEEIVKAIKICLFGENASVLFWINLCELSGFYETAVNLGREVIKENCPKEKDVQKFLRPLYKEAKEDKEFMKTIYKPGANKWLIPMLWYLKDKHPEALEPGTSSDGFA